VEQRRLHDPAPFCAGGQRVLPHRDGWRDIGVPEDGFTREAIDKLLDDRLAAPFADDANDVLYQWDASRDYKPAPGLERIRAAVLAINSAVDERNPPDIGIMRRELKRLRNAHLFLIRPAKTRTAT
jgi:hypothetical protein